MSVGLPNSGAINDQDQYVVARLDSGLVRVLGPLPWKRAIAAWTILDLARREGRIVRVKGGRPDGWRALEVERVRPDWLAVRSGPDPMPFGSHAKVSGLPVIPLSALEGSPARGAFKPEYPVRRWGASHGYESAAGGWVYRLGPNGERRPVTQGWNSFAITHLPAGRLVRLGPRYWLTLPLP